MTVLNTASEGNEKDGKRLGRPKAKPKMMLVEKPVYEELALSAIIVDLELQSRFTMDMEHVRMLGKRREDGLPIEPPVVFKDESDPRRVRYYLADGFHRHLDAKKAGLRSMKVEIKIGTRRDAMIYSAGANQKFSLPRKSEDIRKATFMLFGDEEWWSRSNTVIASHVGVTGGTINKYRVEFALANSINMPDAVLSKDNKHKPYRVPTRHDISLRRISFHKHAYTARIDGKTVKLATKNEGESVARQKLNEIAAKRSSDIAGRHPNVVIRWLSTREIHATSTPRNEFTNFVAGIHLERIAAVTTAFENRDAAPAAIGKVLLLRERYCPGGRAVILCNTDCCSFEISRFARQLGVEFLTPDEFVASVKSDDDTSGDNDDTNGDNAAGAVLTA